MSWGLGALWQKGGSSVKDWMVYLDYLLRLLNFSNGWISLVLNKTWQCKREVLWLRRSGDNAGLTAMVGTGDESIWQRRQSSSTSSFWQVCGPSPYSKLFETTPNASHIFILQHSIRKSTYLVASTETKNEAAEKREDETLSRTVEGCLHKSTTEENKIQSSHWFSGSYSCNPDLQYDGN